MMKGVIAALLILALAYYQRDAAQHFLRTNEHSPFFSAHFNKDFNVFIFKNGFDEGNTTYTVIRKDSTWDLLKKQMADALYPDTQKNSIHVHNIDGDEMTSIDDLSPDNRFYITINNELYILPGVHVGYRRKVGGVELETLSILPRVFKLHGFLKQEEADAIVEDASKQAKIRSTVLEAEGAREESPTRTSSTYYVLYPSHAHVLQRAYDITKVPNDNNYVYPDHQLQVIHYGPNQFFHPHHDGFSSFAAHKEAWFMDGKRNRFLTVFIYLNDVEEGGETAFIRSDDFNSFKFNEYHVHDNNVCDKSAAIVSPKKGDAVLFYNLKIGNHMNGEIEQESLHTGCGVKKGEKWACNVWIYNSPMPQDEFYISIMKDSKLHPEDYVAKTYN